MYIRQKTISGRTYYYLVEGIWENGKVRQRTIRYLGKEIPEDIDEILGTRSEHSKITNRFRHKDNPEKKILGIDAISFQEMEKINREMAEQRREEMRAWAEV